MGIIQAIVPFLRAFILGRARTAIENIALRQQLAVKQSVKRPKLRPRDRVFWVWLSRLWANWRSALVIVQPETVTRHHGVATCDHLEWFVPADLGNSRRFLPAPPDSIRSVRRHEYLGHSPWSKLPCVEPSSADPHAGGVGAEKGNPSRLSDLVGT